MTAKLKAHLALFTGNLMYGANYVVAKGLMPKIIQPNGFIWLRVTGAMLIFWLLFLARLEKVEKKDWLRLIACALFGVTINQLCFFNGLSRTSPVNAAVIMTTTPILVLILSFFILKERMRMLQIFGVLLGAISAIFFTLRSSESVFATSVGDGFIFANALSYALYLIMVKKLMSKYKPLTVITYVFTIGFIFVSFWPYSIPEFSEVQWTALELENVLRLLFVVLCVTVLPYGLTIFAMKNLSPSVVSIYIYLQPLLASFFVYVFHLLGKEDYTGDFSWLKTILALNIFIGVYLVIRPYKKPSQEMKE